MSVTDPGRVALGVQRVRRDVADVATTAATAARNGVMIITDILPRLSPTISGPREAVYGTKKTFIGHVRLLSGKSRHPGIEGLTSAQQSSSNAFLLLVCKAI